MRVIDGIERHHNLFIGFFNAPYQAIQFLNQGKQPEGVKAQEAVIEALKRALAEAQALLEAQIEDLPGEEPDDWPACAGEIEHEFNPNECHRRQPSGTIANAAAARIRAEPARRSRAT